MKIRKRIICILMVMLLLSSIIRIGNIYVLCFGDYSKKNVYAASIFGSRILKSVDDEISAGIRREFYHFGVSFEKGYEFIYINPGTWWYIMGAFDIHNFGDDIDCLSFIISNYYINVFFEEDGISMEYIGKSKNDYVYFEVKNGKVSQIDDRYKVAFEEHKDIVDDVIIKSEEIKEDYKGIMDKFCKRAIIIETLGFALSIVLFGLLTRRYKKYNLSDN